MNLIITPRTRWRLGFIATGTLLFAYYFYCSFILSKRMNLLPYGSSIFDADVWRFPHDWLYLNDSGGRNIYHPLTNFFVAPFGMLLRVLFFKNNPFDALRLICIPAVILNSAIIALVVRKLTDSRFAIVAFALCGVSFASLLFACVPESAAIASISGSLPFLLLYYRIGKRFSYTECILWALTGVFAFGITVTQIMNWGAALGGRILLFHSSDKNKPLLGKALLCLSLFLLLLSISIFTQLRVNPQSTYYFSKIGQERNHLRLNELISQPVYHTVRLGNHFLIYSFMGVTPKLSDFLMNAYGLKYYSISIEEQTLHGWSKLQGFSCLLLLLLLYMPIIRYGRINRVLLPLFIALGGQFVLHLLYGREYVLYSGNWHGLTVAASFGLLQTVPTNRRRFLLSGIALLCVILAINNALVMKRVYNDYSTRLTAPANSPEVSSQEASVMGNIAQSITDGDFNTLISTWNNTMQRNAWFQVKYDPPIQASVIIFGHGRNYFNGGWFDTTNGLPEIWISSTPGEPLRKIIELSEYPRTTTASPGDLHNGQEIRIQLPQKITISKLRVTGVPSKGNNVSESFASCSELRAE